MRETRPHHPPPRPLLATLCVLATLGGIAIAAELAVLRPVPESPVAIPATPLRVSAFRPRLAVTVEAALRGILSRPLFTRGRRPPPDVSNRPDARPRLAGIVATPASITAIFAGERAGQRGAILLAGGRIDGWTLSQITAHEVWLRRNHQELRLRPSFGPPPAPDLRRVAVLGTKHVNPQLA